MVNGTFMAPAAAVPKRSTMSSPAMVAGGGPSAAKAGTAVVGVSSTSTSSKSAATSSSSCRRRRSGFTSVGTGRSTVDSSASDHGRGEVAEPVGIVRRGRRRSSQSVSTPALSQVRTGSVRWTSTSTSVAPGRRRPATSAAARVRSATSGSTTAKPEVERPPDAQARHVERLDGVARRTRRPAAARAGRGRPGPRSRRGGGRRRARS